ncbi:MAG: acyl-CoA synthetase [Gammaproteobacteria bacterium]|nr:acyl-CoA synthetase [Gammaproteobacteria bacterium]
MNEHLDTPWEWNIPEFFNIAAACTDAHSGTSVAEQQAIIIEDDELGISSATYSELAELTSRFAQLLDKLPVRPGERVLIRLPNSLDYPTAFLGAMKAGAISVPTSTLLVAEEVVFLAEDSGAAVLVTHKSMWYELHQELEYSKTLRHVLLAGEGPLPADCGHLKLHDLEIGLAAPLNRWTPFPTRADDPAYLVYTSGTTGHPKGVLHAHRAMIGRRPATEHWFDLTGADRILHSGKFNWTYALGTALMDPMFNGKTVIVHEGDNRADNWPKLIARHQCTIFIGVPRVFRQIIQKTGYCARDVPSLRHCMSAGEHLSDELRVAWRERFNQEIYEGLGMSECSYYISQDVNKPIRPGSAGFIQPGHEIALLNEHRQPVADGEEGMICVAETDPGLFLRYWNREQETRETRHDGWFFTGDYAWRDVDGSIWFQGRRDDIINTFGYRVSPHEVERVMKPHPDIADCVAVPEAVDAETTLVAICVIMETGARKNTDSLIEYGRHHLASYKCPKRVYYMNDFPRTRNGKVIRSALKQKIEISSA